MNEEALRPKPCEECGCFHDARITPCAGTVDTPPASKAESLGSSAGLGDDAALRAHAKLLAEAWFASQSINWPWADMVVMAYSDGYLAGRRAESAKSPNESGSATARGRAQ
jgi:hypothetical protein